MSAPSFVQPFGFANHIKSSPGRGFNIVPFLDLLLIFIFAAIISSHWILLPGIPVELSQGQSQVQQPLGPVTVLTISANRMLFLEGLKVAEATLPDFLRAAAARHAHQERGATLMIKADQSLQTGEIIQYMEMAGHAGFARVHLAVEPAQPTVR